MLSFMFSDFFDFFESITGCFFFNDFCNQIIYKGRMYPVSFAVTKFTIKNSSFLKTRHYFAIKILYPIIFFVPFDTFLHSLF